MKTRYKAISFDKVPMHVVKKLSYHFGTFRDLLTESKSTKKQFSAFLAYDKTEPIGLAIVWSFDKSSPKKERHMEFGVYVDSKYRRRGIGSKLLNMAKSRIHEFEVYPEQSNGSLSFFEYNGAFTDQDVAWSNWYISNKSKNSML